jgi:hypothetical protein
MIVRIKPFTDKFGKVIDIHPDRGLLVTATYGNRHPREKTVWLRPADVEEI